MSIKKARKTLQNKEKFNYDILDKVANSGGYPGVENLWAESVQLTIKDKT